MLFSCNFPNKVFLYHFHSDTFCSVFGLLALDEKMRVHGILRYCIEPRKVLWRMIFGRHIKTLIWNEGNILVEKKEKCLLENTLKSCYRAILVFSVCVFYFGNIQRIYYETFISLDCFCRHQIWSSTETAVAIVVYVPAKPHSTTYFYPVTTSYFPPLPEPADVGHQNEMCWVRILASRPHSANMQICLSAFSMYRNMPAPKNINQHRKHTAEPWVSAGSVDQTSHLHQQTTNNEIEFIPGTIHNYFVFYARSRCPRTSGDDHPPSKYILGCRKYFTSLLRSMVVILLPLAIVVLLTELLHSHRPTDTHSVECFMHTVFCAGLWHIGILLCFGQKPHIEIKMYTWACTAAIVIG